MAILSTACNARGARAITHDSVYKVLIKYASQAGIDIEGFGPHALRATVATNALEHDADIAKVQQWLEHANISTTRVYDRRQMSARTARRSGSCTESMGNAGHLSILQANIGIQNTQFISISR